MSCGDDHLPSAIVQSGHFRHRVHYQGSRFIFGIAALSFGSVVGKLTFQASGSTGISSCSPSCIGTPTATLDVASPAHASETLCYSVSVMAGLSGESLTTLANIPGRTTIGEIKDMITRDFPIPRFEQVIVQQGSSGKIADEVQLQEVARSGSHGSAGAKSGVPVSLAWMRNGRIESKVVDHLREKSMLSFENFDDLEDMDRGLREIVRMIETRAEFEQFRRKGDDTTSREENAILAVEFCYNVVLRLVWFWEHERMAHCRMQSDLGVTIELLEKKCSIIHEKIEFLSDPQNRRAYKQNQQELDMMLNGVKAGLVGPCKGTEVEMRMKYYWLEVLRNATATGFDALCIKESEEGNEVTLSVFDFLDKAFEKKRSLLPTTPAP